MKEYYHYTLLRNIESIIRNGVYPNHAHFTTNQYYNSRQAGYAIGVMPLKVECVLLFKDDGRFKPYRPPIVPGTYRFPGGGATQYSHPFRPIPFAVRKIDEQNWTII